MPLTGPASPRRSVCAPGALTFSFPRRSASRKRNHIMWLNSWFRGLTSKLRRTGSSRPGVAHPVRPAGFRPRLEALEDRWCPSCTVSVVDGHLLQVVGDRADNHIDIVGNGLGGIQVAADGAPARTFTGINKIVV